MSPLLLTSHNNPAAVATDSAVVDLIVAIGFPWVSAVVMVSAIAGITDGAVVLPVLLRTSQESLLWQKSLPLPLFLLLLMSFLLLVYQTFLTSILLPFLHPCC